MGRLTAAGRAFLDHARLALAQADAAGEAARRSAQPARKTFAIGFQTGHEMNWLPEAMQILRVVRRSSETRSSASRVVICRLTAPGEMRSCRAAAEKLPASTTRTYVAIFSKRSMAAALDS
jgi:hypothetical protein